MTITISIIVPTLNEEKVLGKSLSRLRRSKGCEILVVDGGSSDGTLTVARDGGCRIISSPRGRARQMNCGAAEARGEVLLFLHADTLMPDNFQELILNTVNRPDVAAGAFSLAIDSPLKRLAAIAWTANLRSRFLHLPYGDQGIFLRRSVFDAICGFPEMEIMEDFVFIQKAKKEGKVIILQACATTSARRWENMGILRTTLINQLIVCGYLLGVPTKVLRSWYRRLQGVVPHQAN